MKARTFLQPALIVALAGMLTGCETAKDSLTGRLWNAHQFTHFREPAMDPRPTVFYAPAFDDYLVAYDSLLDGADAPLRQNYFVIANERNVADHKQPNLVSTNALNLIGIPLNGPTNVLPYATYDTLLTIYSEQERLGPYPLPNYKESNGTAIKAALTPLTVTGDATVVGLVLSLVGLVGLCASGFSTAVH